MATECPLRELYPEIEPFQTGMLKVRQKIESDGMGGGGGGGLLSLIFPFSDLIVFSLSLFFSPISLSLSVSILPCRRWCDPSSSLI